jgi:predicted nucleotidyltransferase
MNYGLSGKITSVILGVLEKHSAVEQALIFGSRAKGNFKTGSDIDLALSGNSLSTDEALCIQGEMEDAPIPHKVDILILSKITNPDLRDHIQRVGQIFFEKPHG